MAIAELVHLISSSIVCVIGRSFQHHCCSYQCRMPGTKWNP